MKWREITGKQTEEKKSDSNVLLTVGYSLLTSQKYWMSY